MYLECHTKEPRSIDDMDLSKPNWKSILKIKLKFYFFINIKRFLFLFLIFWRFAPFGYLFFSTFLLKQFSIQLRLDSNPQPLDRESYALTTGPGCLPFKHFLLILKRKLKKKFDTNDSNEIGKKNLLNLIQNCSVVKSFHWNLNEMCCRLCVVQRKSS